uniref:Guanylate cyclase domain-containing protein n=1 Tax=Tetradesmus obliquus TaxID=3088 RepID=A0A383VRV6_TETOB|eukprot:jgi/Sobl393_1/17106/SZX68247.1
MDEATFARIKEELHPLGAVDANGLNYDKLAQRTSLWQLLCLGTLCSSRRHDMLDADEAVVLDMGQYEVPAPPQKVASMRNANASLRQSLKIVWPQMLTQPHAADLPASSGLQESGGGLQESGGLQDGYLLQPTSSLPGAVPLACSSYGYGQQQQQQQQQQQRGSAGGADASGNAPLTARQRVRLVQILAPSLVGRAAVWGNQLSLKSSWVCCDAPYYEAPGAVEAPLGNAVAGRTNSLGAAAAAAGAAASSSPQLQLQQQLDTSTATGSAGLSPTASLSLGAADAAAAAATDTAGDAPKHNFAVAAFASVDSEQQAMLCISSPAAAAAGAASSYWHHNAPQQQQLLGRQLAPPMPPVTMVFLVVEGAKVFGKGRRPLVKEVHAQLAALLVEALKHTQGGYLCRMQEGDLKYMVAFSSARSALEWCLLVQEAALYLHWPDKSFARIPQLRSEYDAEGQLVFRGPRLKMGVCEGVPRTIIPDHLGRADYHGSSINQAARYMDAGAHGGQIACEAELAAAVFAEWAHSGSSSSNATPGGSSAADEEGASMDPAVVRTASAPVAAAGGGAAAAGSGLEADCMLLDGAGGSAELDGGCGAAGAGGPPVLRSNTSRSLDSGLAQLRSTGSSEAAQQQQQQGAAAGAAGCVRCTCSASCAADSMGASGCNCGAAAAAAAAAECGRAEHAGSMGSPFAMSADAAAIAAGAAAGVPAGSANAVPDCTAAAAVQPALSGECSTTSSKESGTAAAAAAAGGSGSGLGSRLSRLFVKSSSTRSRLGYSSTDIKQQELQLAAAATDEQHTAAAAAAAAVSKVAFAGGPGHQSTAAAAPPPSAAPRFGLSEVPRVPVAVSAHHLGSFRFKGNPQPLQMVNVMAASLAGRAALFPADPPKGKGNRVAAGEGLAGSAVAQLPTLALQYRARVPHHVLELVPATPLAGAVGAADPKGLLRGQLRTASMPVTRSRTMMAGLRWGAGSPVDDAAQQQQQQDVEGGLGFGIGLLRLPSSRASSSGRSLSFLMQQRHTPSIPEEPGWDAAAAGKDVGATAAAAAGYADACGVDVRSSTSSNGSGGWASSLGGLFGAGGSHGSKARLAQSLRSQSAIVSRTSSSGGGCESAGVGPFGRSSGSAPHSQRPSASNGADVVIPLAVLREQHSAAAPDAA